MKLLSYIGNKLFLDDLRNQKFQWIVGSSLLYSKKSNRRRSVRCHQSALETEDSIAPDRFWSSVPIAGGMIRAMLKLTWFLVCPSRICFHVRWYSEPLPLDVYCDNELSLFVVACSIIKYFLRAMRSFFAWQRLEFYVFSSLFSISARTMKASLRQSSSFGCHSRESGKQEWTFEGKSINSWRSVAHELLSSVLSWKYRPTSSILACRLLYSQSLVTCGYVLWAKSNTLSPCLIRPWVV